MLWISENGKIVVEKDEMSFWSEKAPSEESSLMVRVPVDEGSSNEVEVFEIAAIGVVRSGAGRL